MTELTLEVPVGAIIATILNPKSPPAGWLPCDGSPIPARYSELITLLGSEVTPNLIGRTLIGAGPLASADTKQTDGRDPRFAALGTALQTGAIGGECQHALSVTELAKHSHTINRGNFGVHGRSFQGSDDDDRPFETHPHQWLHGTDETGDGTPHFNVQPYRAVTYLICAGKM